MPDYRRKKSHTGRRKRAGATVQKARVSAPKRRNKETAALHSEPEKRVRIIRGGKEYKRRRLYVLASVVLVIALVTVILSILSPVSLYESAQDFTKSIGSGSFPAAISGSGITDCVPKDRYYYVLSDTSVMAFTNGGKKIFSFVHGFAVSLWCW